MAKRVKIESSCRDCSRCTGSPLGNAARATVRGTVRSTAALATLGLSEALTRRCRLCGHVMGTHR
ncbi:hypothetical protein [Kitasatospora mediocidica]|uniref:hypothetical protein n=1 Tax=Kitasatospora mediocidica TaxID=58352 RepID=UPI00055E3C45|nr:hypothetical protein [Kitasatospora mediocidica]